MALLERSVTGQDHQANLVSRFSSAPLQSQITIHSPVISRLQRRKPLLKRSQEQSQEHSPAPCTHKSASFVAEPQRLPNHAP